MASEAALRQYCSSTLVKEYEQISSEGQKELLEVMITGLRDALRPIFMIQSLRGNNKLTVRQALEKIVKSPSFKSCPLVKAFLELGVSPQLLVDEDYIEISRKYLKVWGNVMGSSPIDKFFYYQQVVSRAKQTYHQKDDHNNNNNNISPSSSSTINGTVMEQSGVEQRADWQTLRSIRIGDLKLFETCSGCCLEGHIAGEAIIPMSGGLVLVQDSTGDYIIAKFDNFLPEGICGLAAEPFLQTIFPLGATIRIAEPYAKIFADGLRGIRVDNRADIQVDYCSSPKNLERNDAALAERKQMGNELFGKKKYSAAIDVYLDALNSNYIIPTLLSNRCQAFMCLDQWCDGLLDAAASLTIRPESSETWARYDECLSKVKGNGDVQNSDVLRKLIPHLKPPPLDRQVNPMVNTDLAETLQSKGNGALEENSYADAVSYYSQALLEAGGTVRTLLLNWAQCAIETEALHDIIAAACAATRIGVDEKSIYRLSKGLCMIGEIDQAISVLELFPTSKILRDLCQQAKTAKSWLRDPNLISRDELIYDTPPLLSNWIGPVETYVTPDKGRGLRAREDLAPGQVIFIDRAVAKAEPDMFCPGTSSRGAFFNTPATAALKHDLPHRCNLDAVLSDILNQLTDGSKTKPLVPLSSLVRTLDSCPILLPGLFTHRKGKKSTLTAETIHAIIDMNIHTGKSGQTDLRKVKGKPSQQDMASCLHPLMSTMNHARHPNCSCCVTNDSSVAVVFVIKPVRRGMELCLQYHEDERIAAKQWKFGVVES